MSLVVPDDPSLDSHMQAGATITPHRRSRPRCEKVLSDLYPLLRTVQPADLNTTLNALATALEGRGDELGENLVTVDSYLKRLNPQIPAIVEDLRLTARVSDTYADVMPADRRRSCATPSRPRAPSRTGTRKLQALFTDVTSFSDTAHDFLRRQRRQHHPARPGQRGRSCGCFAKYAPEYPCLHQGHRERRRAPGRGVPRLHPAHRARDAAEPAARLHRRRTCRVFGDDRGPTCLHLPNPPWSPVQPGARTSRTSTTASTSPTGKGTDRVAPRLLARQPAPGTPAAPSRVDAAQVPARSRRWACRPPTSPTSACSWSGRWPAGRRCRCDERASTSKTTVDLTKLVIFIVVDHAGDRRAGDHDRQPLASAARKEYKAEFVDATGVVKGDDVRIAGVKVGSVKDVEIVDRTRALVTFTVDRRHRAHRGDPRRHPLPQPRRPALHLAHQRDRRHRRCSTRARRIPVVADLAGARPDRALQRLQAAVPGAVAGRHQQALLRDHPGLPGRGRHPRGPARAHRLGDQHARRPRPGDRRA